MTKQSIIPLIIHHMLQFNQPFSPHELHSKLEQQGIIIENIQGMITHFIHAKTLVATEGKYQVNVQALFS